MRRPQAKTRAERELHEAVRLGEALSVNVAGDNNSSNGSTWNEDRQIGAHHLVWLCRSLEAGRTLSLSCVRVVGTFDISSVRKHISVEIVNCYFDDEVIANAAELERLRLDRSHLPGFDGRGMRTTRNLSLAGTRIRGSCLLEDARVEGSLMLKLAELSNGGAVALDATRMHVKGRLDACDCRAEGSVLLNRAVVEEGVLLDGMRVADVQGFALDATHLRVYRGDLSIVEHVDIGGRVLLTGVDVSGDVRIGGMVKGDNATAAVQATGLVVGGNLVLDQGTQLVGALLLRNAKIEKSFQMTGVSIHSATGPGVDASGVRAGEITVDAGSTVEGGGNLSLAIIAGSVEIGGRWSSFRQGGDALDATGLTVQDGSITLLDGAVFEGRLSLAKVSVPDVLDIRDVQLTNPGGTALDLSASTTADRTRTGELRIAVKRPIDGAVSLRNALVTRLVDEPATWHRTSQIDLQDFGFLHLDEKDAWPARDRLGWLVRGTSPPTPSPPSRNRVARWLKGGPPLSNTGPYDSLERAYQADGRGHEARQVRKVRWGQVNRSRVLPLRLGGWLLRLAVGTGAVPWPAFVWLGVLELSGGTYFTANPLPSIDPAKPATWNPWLYTLDRIVPWDLGWEKPFRTVDAMDHVVSLVLFGSALALGVSLGFWLKQLLTRNIEAKKGP